MCVRKALELVHTSFYPFSYSVDHVPFSHIEQWLPGIQLAVKQSYQNSFINYAVFTIQWTNGWAFARVLACRYVYGFVYVYIVYSI